MCVTLTRHHHPTPQKNQQPTNKKKTKQKQKKASSYNWSSPGWQPSASEFTQLVWADSTVVGCAANAGCTDETYVCLYKLRGNDLNKDWSTEVAAAKPGAS